ncbi:MAG: hypothetical protein Q7K03_05665 [Dehalococcoidia bacterium]|nr:hypothetical protein [Dehalococcoidia bacterium]
MGHEATCHVPHDVRLQAGKVAPLRRVLPLVAGFAGTGLLVMLYLGIVTWAQGLTHALELFSQDRAFVAAIAAGFGLQVGLYSYLRLVVHHGVRLAMPTAATGVGTGTSSLAMVACCIHHVADVLPVLGLSGAAIFLNQYRVPIMVVGLAVNAVGVVIMLRVVLQGRAHLRTLRARAMLEMQ